MFFQYAAIRHRYQRIYAAQDDNRAKAVLEEIASMGFLYLSVVTEIELFSQPNINVEESARLRRMLDTMFVAPVDSKIGAIASRLRREYRMKLGDSIIAATAIFFGTTLLTRNVRDFKHVPDLSMRAV